jgi:2-polyprenyl-6-methoxyphenol hydroxylase-like FAD-dependent oxidoreductase
MPSQDRPAEPRESDGVDDVVIVGAGFGGSALALALARRGRKVTVVDPHALFPADFRCEKLSPTQLGLAGATGLLDAFAGLDVVGEGHRYERLVRRLRDAWPAEVRFIEGKATGIAASADIQSVRLASGETARARLAVLATGPGEKLRAGLGIGRRLLRERHSLSIGFTLACSDGGAAPKRSFVCHGRAPGDRIAYASFFPMAGGTRVNLFTYHDPRDGWALALRSDPTAGLMTALPASAAALRGMAVSGPVEMRSTDLYTSEGHVQAGVVLIGDAFAACCPATGMGLTRILIDVQRLAETHLPAWLATPGMGEAKIAAFYEDAAKQVFETEARRKSARGRSVAVETSLPWRIIRSAGRLRDASRAAGHRLLATVSAGSAP